MDKDIRLQTVVETSEYIKQAEKCMDKSSRVQLVGFIAANPFVGDLISGTGGARKVRWAGGSNEGKRGGVRVIYYYHDENMPIFLFTTYGKNKKANLTKDERNALRVIIKQIVAVYEG